VPDARVLAVRQFVKATPTSRILRLELDAPFRFQAGQAARIGVPGQTTRKPYSIASAPEDAEREGCLEFLVKVDADGRPPPHLAGARRGARVAVEGPLGTFRFPRRPAGRAVLFVAGGTGIAPMRSMLRHALSARYAGRLIVLYSARSEREFAYGAELRQLARRGSIELRLTATRQAAQTWRGQRGRINLASLADLGVDRTTLCFICGPPTLLAAARPLLERMGVPASHVRMDKW